jgi:hypothetical protein
MSKTKLSTLDEYISMGYHLTIHQDIGKWWVDTGHADVGPFDTSEAARAHANRIISDAKDHGIGF